MHVLHALGQFRHFADALRSSFDVRNTPAVRLHRRTDVARDVLRVFARGRLFQHRETLEREVGGVAGSGLCSFISFTCLMMWLPAARPNTTRSSSEFVPSRFARALTRTSIRPLHKNR